MTAGLDEASAEAFRFVPLVRVGDQLAGGAAFGRVETQAEPAARDGAAGCSGGEVVEMAAEGVFRDDEIVCRLRDGTTIHELAMSQRWPVRVPRPVAGRLPADEPLVTGQRVIDCLFPIARGGTAAIPGGFGTGKTMLHERSPSGATPTSSSTSGAASAATRWPTCSTEFPQLEDPRSGPPAASSAPCSSPTPRTCPCRRARPPSTPGSPSPSTIRDRASTWRSWRTRPAAGPRRCARSPGGWRRCRREEGFPAYLPHAARRLLRARRRGSARSRESRAPSPSSGPSPARRRLLRARHQHTKRFIGCFWALDVHRAQSRLYPAIHPLQSYSVVASSLARWWHTEGCTRWAELRRRFLTARGGRPAGADGEHHRQGRDARAPASDAAMRPAGQRVFLRQSAFSANDRYATPQRQAVMMRLIGTFIEGAEGAEGGRRARARRGGGRCSAASCHRRGDSGGRLGALLPAGPRARPDLPAAAGVPREPAAA